MPYNIKAKIGHIYTYYEDDCDYNNYNKQK